MKDEHRIDRKLWFTMVSCKGRHFAIYNSHTFHGRFTAWCPVKKRAVNVSKAELRTSSEQMKYWLKGFLSGNEPGPPRMENGLVEELDSENFKRWQSAIDLFSETGFWSSSQRTCKACGKPLLPSALACTCKGRDS